MTASVSTVQLFSASTRERPSLNLNSPYQGPDLLSVHTDLQASSSGSSGFEFMAIKLNHWKQMAAIKIINLPSSLPGMYLFKKLECSTDQQKPGPTLLIESRRYVSEKERAEGQAMNVKNECIDRKLNQSVCCVLGKWKQSYIVSRGALAVFAICFILYLATRSCVCMRELRDGHHHRSRVNFVDQNAFRHQDTRPPSTN